MITDAPTVFIVDDDDDVRKALSRALVKRGFKVDVFSSAEAFLTTYNPVQTGCLVLDFGMPHMNGLELQAELNRRNYLIPIIFITGHGGVPETVQAIRSGAVDFLEKPFRQDILHDRIRAAFQIDEKARRDDDDIARARADFCKLTDREKEIASLMASQPSDASSKLIARQLKISPRTVDHHRARILEKMNVRSVAELVDVFGKAKLFDS